MRYITDFLKDDDLEELVNWCDDHKIVFKVDAYFYGREQSCRVEIETEDTRYLTYAALRWGFMRW